MHAFMAIASWIQKRAADAAEKGGDSVRDHGSAWEVSSLDDGNFGKLKGWFKGFNNSISSDHDCIKTKWW